MHAVNLVPESFRHEQARSARIRGWALTVVVTLLVSSVPVARLMLSRAQTKRLTVASAGVQAELVDLERRCQLATTEREALTEQATLIAAPVDTSNVPEALARIASEAPSGLMLTRVNLASATRGSKPAPTNNVRDAPASPTAMPRRVFVIEGFAADHSVVLAFTQVVEAAPACRGVQLVRSQRVQHAQGELQSFALECDWEDDAS
jgi:hypothetical protein